MRIAVVSLKVNANYGGLLQAWAMQQVLRRMGHEPVLIDTPGLRPLPLLTRLWLYPWRAFRKYVCRSGVDIRRESYIYNVWRLRMEGVAPFISTNLAVRTVRSLDELSEGEFDAVVFGSDQVWRPCYFRKSFGDMRHAFGWFAREWPDIRLLSYAASFGIGSLEEYTGGELEDIRRMLPRFTGVSVRERSGVDLCGSLGVTDAMHVLDPTLLLDKTDYLPMADKSVSRQGVMVYLLDDTEGLRPDLDRLSAALGCGWYSALTPDGVRGHSMGEWLAGFRDADFIITDSFHACIFAMLFGKPFVVLANPVRGTARIDSLLDMFGLAHHKINTLGQISDDVERYRPDMTAVYEILTRERERSMAFLGGTLQ